MQKTPVVIGKWLNLYEVTTPEGAKRLQFEKPVKDPSEERLSTGSDIVALGKRDGRIVVILEIIFRVPVSKYLI